MDRMYAKVAQDFVDAQRPNGGFPETAPFVGISDQHLEDGTHAINLGGGSGPVDWGVAPPLLACQLWQYYGDSRVLMDQYSRQNAGLTFYGLIPRTTCLITASATMKVWRQKPRFSHRHRVLFFKRKPFRKNRRAYRVSG